MFFCRKSYRKFPLRRVGWLLETTMNVLNDRAHEIETLRAQGSNIRQEVRYY